MKLVEMKRLQDGNSSSEARPLADCFHTALESLPKLRCRPAGTSTAEGRGAPSSTYKGWKKVGNYTFGDVFAAEGRLRGATNKSL